jgi:diadenylate cyclase
LELNTLSWILSWFFGFFAIALLVIFQPELRRGLAELGSRPFFYSPIRAREVIDILCATAQSLSEKRIGALIAIEGAIGFRGIVERGVEMDCKVAVETLTTVFHPSTPLHDGCVVIRGDRIASAACIFPLSERRGLDMELGTRHRAALGLTEETDAVVIIVSEETGRISVAHRAMFQRDLTAATLGKTLDELMLPSQMGASKWGAAIRRWLGLAESRETVERQRSE